MNPNVALLTGTVVRLICSISPSLAASREPASLLKSQNLLPQARGFAQPVFHRSSDKQNTAACKPCLFVLNCFRLPSGYLASAIRSRVSATTDPDCESETRTAKLIGSSTDNTPVARALPSASRNSRASSGQVTYMDGGFR